MSELHKNDDALALLQNNTTTTGKLLRADINMRSQHWLPAAQALLDLVGPPPKAGESLTKEQSQWLVNCASAMALGGDTAGLDKLAKDYGPVLAGMPQNDIFRILTRPEKVGQLRDIASGATKDRRS